MQKVWFAIFGNESDQSSVSAKTARNVDDTFHMLVHHLMYGEKNKKDQIMTIERKLERMSLIKKVLPW